MAFRVFIERRANSQLEKLAVDLRARIIEALEELEKGFYSRLDVKKLKGTRNHYRIRAGDYRILFVLEEDKVYVYDISHRSHVYR